MLKPTLPRRLPAFGLLVLLAILLQLLAPSGSPATPAATIERAWELAQQSGSYSFHSDLIQTTQPAPRLNNTGRGPRRDHLSMEGSIDQPRETMELTLWRNASGKPQDALALRIENGRTYGQVGGQQWREVENVADVFAPGGDPLSFLAGARDIELAGSETREFAGAAQQLSLRYTRYTFRVDGPAFAALMRDRLAQQLRRRGKLPNGLSLDITETYRKMSGLGELWVDQDGLPRRLALQLDLPSTRNDMVHAEITSDYFDFDRGRLALASTPFVENPSAWLSYRLARHAPALQALALGLALSILLLCAVRAWRNRRVYALIVSSVLISMLISPLLRADEVRAFMSEQLAQQAQQEQAQRRCSPSRRRLPRCARAAGTPIILPSPP